jgi:hypothetical protein
MQDGFTALTCKGKNLHRMFFSYHQFNHTCVAQNFFYNTAHSFFFASFSSVSRPYFGTDFERFVTKLDLDGAPEQRREESK